MSKNTTAEETSAPEGDDAVAGDTSRSRRIKHASADRRARQKAGVHEAILVAATELFLVGGYEGFSLRRVAERVGYTPTTVYLYFADKDDLLFTAGRVLPGAGQTADAARGALCRKHPEIPS